MRVTMLVRCLAMMRGGGETRHVAWARELTALGAQVDIIAGRPLLFGAPRYRTDDLPARSITLLRSPYTRDFVYRHQHQRGFGRLTMTALHADEEWFCRAAWRRIAASGERPHVVHAHALYQAARLRTGDIPVVINLPGEPSRRYYRDLQLADALVADGWAAQHLPPILNRAVDRVPKGVDGERFRPDGRSLRPALHLEGMRVIVGVARLVPIKNVALLVDAFARLRARIPDARLVIVGDGPEGAALRDLTIQLGVADSVTFTGSLPHAEMPAAYRTGDVFAFSSDFDNSPNAVLEAMASGLPVVATDVGGVREYVDDGIGGTVVPRGDAAAMSQALERYLLQPEAARAAGLHNRARVASTYSWRASALRLLDVYRRVAETRGVGERASA